MHKCYSQRLGNRTSMLEPFFQTFPFYHVTDNYLRQLKENCCIIKWKPSLNNNQLNLPCLLTSYAKLIRLKSSVKLVVSYVLFLAFPLLFFFHILILCSSFII